MTEKLPPISPYQPSPANDHRHGKDKSSKTGRIVKILSRAAVIFFFCYCAARAYYIIYPPYSNNAFEEFCCSCERGYSYTGYTVRERLLLKPQSFFLPTLDISWNPFHISVQHLDGSYEKVIDKPFIFDNFSSRDFTMSSGYFFYASHNQIELVTDDGRVTLVPIRSGSAKYLVETTRIADFCRGPVLATQCYYSDNKPISRSKPVYLDGTQVCPRE